MGNKRIAFNIDHESRYISSRVFTFMYENTQKVKPNIDFSQYEEVLMQGGVRSLDKDLKIDIKVLSDFVQTCLDNKFSFDDFYQVGNHIHELHFSLITVLFKLTIRFAYPMKNEISFLKVNFNVKEDEFNVSIELDEILLLDEKEICTPILKMIHGFTDRIFEMYLNIKPEVIHSEGSLDFTYRQSFVSNFDIAQYITNEQFFFSRLKNNIFGTKDESISAKVQFFLFKDISFSIEEIAAKVDMSVRALQRKLKEEESSFRKIKEKVRRELSKKYLSDLSLSIQEVSELLAYSERSAFEKAFKKWYGQNPKGFRENIT